MASYNIAWSMSAGRSPAPANAAAPERRNAAELVRSGEAHTTALPVASPDPRRCTAGRGRSTARSAALVAGGSTRPGGSLPVNTTGGGLAYTHSGMYGMYALLESVRQLRGEAAAQVDGVSTSLVHAIGGMFQSAATVVLSTEERQ